MEFPLPIFHLYFQSSTDCRSFPFGDMSLLVASSRRLKGLVRSSTPSKPVRGSQKNGSRRSYSNGPNSEFPGLHDDFLTKSSRGSFTEHLDPRTVQGMATIALLKPVQRFDINHRFSLRRRVQASSHVVLVSAGGRRRRSLCCLSASGRYEGFKPPRKVAPNAQSKNPLF